jgi:biotin carboxyl carrier protein
MLNRIGVKNVMNEFIVTVNGKRKFLKLLSNEKIEINGRIIEASFTKVSHHSYILRFENIVFEVAVNKQSKSQYKFLFDGWYYDTVVRTKLQDNAVELQKNKEKQKHHSEFKAPMPGLLLKIKKQVGDAVELGEPILILEAMKMENDLRSPSSGIIKQINFKEGETIEKDSVLLIIE